jgi:hypothetical protein
MKLLATVKIWFLWLSLSICCLELSAQDFYFNKIYLEDTKINWVLGMVVKEESRYVLLYDRTINNIQTSLAICKINEFGDILDSMWIRVDSIFLLGQYFGLKDDGKFIISGTYLDNREPTIRCPLWLEANFEKKSYLLKDHCNSYERSLRNLTRKSNGHLAASGFSTKAGYSQILFIEFDEDGEILVEKEYGQPGWQDAFGSIVEHPEGGFVIGGWIRQPGFFLAVDILVLRIDSNYNLVWSKTIGGEYDDGEGGPLAIDPDGHIILTSSRHRPGSPAYDPYLARLHKHDGRIMMERYYPQEYNSAFYSQPIVFENGDIVGVGYRRVFLEEINFITFHAFITKTNSLGEIIWDRVITYQREASHLTGGGKSIPFEDGFFWLAGSTHPYNERQYGWLVKLDSLGCPFPGCDTISVHVENIPPVEVKGSIVAIPNPFAQHLTLRYTFPKYIRNPVVYVKDMVGRTVIKVAINGMAPVGDVFIDSSSWAPGLYSIQIFSEGQVICSAKAIKR